MKITILPADKKFSWCVRLRDKCCVRCGSMVEFNEKGLPVSHQNSHYWGRGNWGTRFDLENCDTLCFVCHRLWGGDERREYEKFKRAQLGETGYNKLQFRKEAYCKKDKKLADIYATELLKEFI
jgi:hypothetical protein